MSIILIIISIISIIALVIACLAFSKKQHKYYLQDSPINIVISRWKKNTDWSEKFKDIANILSLDFKVIKADTVDVEKHSDVAKKYIHHKILDNSSYYKNMILKISEIEELINNL